MCAYNFVRPLKRLKGLSPYQYACKIWTTEPERFSLNPIRQMPGRNTCNLTSSTSQGHRHPPENNDDADNTVLLLTSLYEADASRSLTLSYWLIFEAGAACPAREPGSVARLSTGAVILYTARRRRTQ